MRFQRLKLDNFAPALLIVEEISNGSEKNWRSFYFPIRTDQLHPSLLNQILRILMVSCDRQCIAIARLHQLGIAHVSLSLGLFGSHSLRFRVLVLNGNRYYTHVQIPFLLIIQSVRETRDC